MIFYSGISYAGIGSRSITEQEKLIIQKTASELSKKDILLYSGNAPGSDINFQIGSNCKCVLYLPWKNFNTAEYDVNKCINHFIVGDTKDGIESVLKFHPNPKSLSKGAKALMSRNFHQIVGYATFPQVSFVLCCANYKCVEDKIQVDGGTGQAVRIANSLNIPVFNIRKPNWLNDLKMFVDTLKT